MVFSIFRLHEIFQVPKGVVNKGKVSQFNGLIGMLERGEIDVAVTDLSLTYSRNQVID